MDAYRLNVLGIRHLPASIGKVALKEVIMGNHSAHRSSIPTDMGDLKSLPLLLNIETASSIPQISDRQMRKWCEDGTVKAVKMGRVWRVNRDSLLAFCGLA